MTLDTYPMNSSKSDDEEGTNGVSKIEDINEGETETMLNKGNEKSSAKETSQENRALEIESSEPVRLRKQYAVSVRWEREMEERGTQRRMPTPNSSLELFHMIFCCCARRIGGMFSLVERSDGSPIIIAGPCWPCCFFITLPLIAGIAGLVTYYVVFNQDLGLPIWVAIVYIPLVVITLISLSCVSCRDPGLLERVTDEEAGHGGWFWNEQVGSFRPTGAMYCRECKALIEDFDHLCPWTGTGIGRRNMMAFKFFVVCVNLSCYSSIGLISYSVVMGIRM